MTTQGHGGRRVCLEEENSHYSSPGSIPLGADSFIRPLGQNRISDEDEFSVSLHTRYFFLGQSGDNFLPYVFSFLLVILLLQYVDAGFSSPMNIVFYCGMLFVVRDTVSALLVTINCPCDCSFLRKK